MGGVSQYSEHVRPQLEEMLRPGPPESGGEGGWQQGQLHLRPVGWGGGAEAGVLARKGRDLNSAPKEWEA